MLIYINRMNLDWQVIRDLAIPAGAVVTWFTKDRILAVLNVKKETNNAQGGNLDNVQKALDLWQEMLDDAIKRHKAQVNEFEGIVSKLKTDFKELEALTHSKDVIITQQNTLIIEQKNLIVKQSNTILRLKKKYESTK